MRHQNGTAINQSSHSLGKAGSSGGQSHSITAAYCFEEGKQHRDESHLLFLVCLGCCAIIVPLEQCSIAVQCSSGLTGGPARLTMQDDGCGKGGTDLIAHAFAHADAASLSLQIWKTLSPLPAANPPARSTPPTGSRSSTILCPGPLQCRAPMPQSSFLTHSTALVPSHSLSSHLLGPTFVTHHQQRPKERQTPSIGLCVCVKGAHCVPATAQRLPIPSTNWPIRPEYRLCTLVPAAGYGRPPAQHWARLASPT